MDSFRHIASPLRLFVGPDSLAVLPKELRRAGVRRAVILCGRSLSDSGALKAVGDAADDALAGVCPSVCSGSPRAAIEAVAKQVSDLQADALIAVGGGSAMVTARAVAILLAEDKPLDELCTSRGADGKMHSPRLDAPKMPIFALPTTPSTAMVKPGTAVQDEARGVRMAFFDPKTRSEAILVHPDLLMTAPETLFRSSALNTLCSGIEGLLSGATDPLALAELIHAVRLCAAGLDAPDTPQTRKDMTMAAILCGRGTDNTGLGLATAISHAVAHACRVEGGVAKACALPHVMRFNRDHIPDGVNALGLALGGTEIADLFGPLGVPARLRDLGVSRDALPAIADACMGDWFIRNNPRPIAGAEDILSLLDSAW